MAYLDVITLAEAKEYLRVDDTLTEDDNHIQRMIKGALDYIERWTNQLVFDRQKTYVMVDGCVTVYDYPVNSTVSTFALTETIKRGYRNYVADDADQTELKLNVGYQNVEDIPNDLIDVAFELIDLMYYSHESGKTVEKDLSELSKNILNKHKQFIL